MVKKYCQGSIGLTALGSPLSKPVSLTYIVSWSAERAKPFGLSKPIGRQYLMTGAGTSFGLNDIIIRDAALSRTKAYRLQPLLLVDLLGHTSTHIHQAVEAL